MAHASGNPHEHTPVKIAADTSRLSTEDIEVLDLLTKAVRLVNSIYLIQRNQDLGSTDIFDGAAGTNYYPQGMTREELDMYLLEHPEEREQILSPFSVVERASSGFRSIPYSEYYQVLLRDISSFLTSAAAHTLYPQFKSFLEAQARAFVTNDYLPAEIAWVTANDAPIELVIGPHEIYLDELYGVKRDIEAYLGIVLSEETEKAKIFQEQITKFDTYLGERYRYTAHTLLTPMIIMDQVLAAGDPLYSYTTMALNLPNDPEIHRTVGSKKVFMRNIIYAKMELISRRIAERVLDPELVSVVEPATVLMFIIGHEAAHGLSFHFTGDDFGPISSSLEECKADVFGLLFLYFLIEVGVCSQEEAERAVMAHLTDGLRQIRFGIDEAHAVGMLVQYNSFLRTGAVRIEHEKLSFNSELFFASLQTLGDELYQLSQTVSETAAKDFVKKEGYVPEAVRDLIVKLEGIPIDIDPIYIV